MTNANLTQPVERTAAPFGDVDPRMALGKAVALGSAVIASVGPDQLDDPTPCTDYSVRDLLGHLVFVLHRVAHIGNGGDPFQVEELEPGSVADDGWSDAWREAAHAVMAAWSDEAQLDREFSMVWKTMTGREALEIYASEVTTHTWDLAVATGQAPEWDSAAVAIGLAAFERESPSDEDRAAGAPFAPAVAVPSEAPAIDRLVGLTGRDPAWTA